MRYYYDKMILSKVHGKRYTYRFNFGVIMRAQRPAQTPTDPAELAELLNIISSASPASNSGSAKSTTKATNSAETHYGSPTGSPNGVSRCAAIPSSPSMDDGSCGFSRSLGTSGLGNGNFQSKLSAAVQGGYRSRSFQDLRGGSYSPMNYGRAPISKGKAFTPIASTNAATFQNGIKSSASGFSPELTRREHNTNGHNTPAYHLASDQQQQQQLGMNNNSSYPANMNGSRQFPGKTRRVLGINTHLSRSLSPSNFQGLMNSPISSPTASNSPYSFASPTRILSAESRRKMWASQDHSMTHNDNHYHQFSRADSDPTTSAGASLSSSSNNLSNQAQSHFLGQQPHPHPHHLPHHLAPAARSSSPYQRPRADSDQQMRLRAMPCLTEKRHSLPTELSVKVEAERLAMGMTRPSPNMPTIPSMASPGSAEYRTQQLYSSSSSIPGDVTGSGAEHINQGAASLNVSPLTSPRGAVSDAQNFYGKISSQQQQQQQQKHFFENGSSSQCAQYQEQYQMHDQAQQHKHYQQQQQQQKMQDQLATMLEQQSLLGQSVYNQYDGQHQQQQQQQQLIQQQSKQLQWKQEQQQQQCYHSNQQQQQQQQQQSFFDDLNTHGLRAFGNSQSAPSLSSYSVPYPTESAICHPHPHQAFNNDHPSKDVFQNNNQYFNGY